MRDGKISVNPRHVPVEEVRRNEVKQKPLQEAWW